MSKKSSKTPKPDLKVETVQARYNFTSDELIALDQQAGREQAEYGRLESELSSIKKDYGSKMDAAEMRRNVAFRKLEDRFEMRETEAVIEFNCPAVGRKTIYRRVPGAKDERGEVIENAAMSPADLQTEFTIDGSPE